MPMSLSVMAMYNRDGNIEFTRSCAGPTVSVPATVRVH